MTVLVIGLPVYDGAEHAQEALESLLGQTLRDIAIVVTDDHPDRPCAAVFERCDDPRVTYEANPRRLGLVGNWRHCFERARALHPEAPYFAWAGDHDVRHPLWAERSVAALQRHPDAVLAASRTYRMRDDGTTLPTKDWSVDIPGALPARTRVRRAVREMSAGNMIYGVFRADALERVGAFHHVLLPDRYVIAELAMLGGIVTVPERLFYRRATATPSIERQRAAFWPDGVPRYARLPWTAQHTGAAWLRLLRGDTGPAGASLGERAGLAAAHTTATVRYAVRRNVGRTYYHAVGGRSLKAIGAKQAGRVVDVLGQRPAGRRALGLARRAVDAVPSRGRR